MQQAPVSYSCIVSHILIARRASRRELNSCPLSTAHAVFFLHTLASIYLSANSFRTPLRFPPPSRFSVWSAMAFYRKLTHHMDLLLHESHMSLFSCTQPLKKIMTRGSLHLEKLENRRDITQANGSKCESSLGVKTVKSLIFAPENQSNIKEWNMNARVSSEEG